MRSVESNRAAAGALWAGTSERQRLSINPPPSTQPLSYQCHRSASAHYFGCTSSSLTLRTHWASCSFLRSLLLGGPTGLYIRMSLACANVRKESARSREWGGYMEETHPSWESLNCYFCWEEQPRNNRKVIKWLRWLQLFLFFVFLL